ncbi:protein translocase subunit SecF [Candidatus Peregrinibacteria bacterium CG10_big_fil_rev_8_21_14_0_10_36_19]|nr:MAG: protein translocase subunit SecF [Candidatus Peregrinibacteria bacterium CG10_big_fil_rev_8_21_14_0_10_36_19]
MKNFFSWKNILILLIAATLGVYDLPTSIQESLPLPQSFKDAKIQLGLDLQGGSQLDYKLDLRKVPQADQASIIEGVREVLEKRVNGLGVAEPNIYISNVADETHIIVELAETANITQEDIKTYLGGDKTIETLTDDEKKLVSLEKAKATVGKTIQLEFKEQKAELDPEESKKIKEQAEQALSKINNGSSFSVIGQEEQQANPGKVTYETSEYVFESDLKPSIKDAITKLEKNAYTKNLIEVTGDFVLTESGEVKQDTSLSLFKLLDKKEELKSNKEVATSHILIAWKGSEGANDKTTRTKEEALELAKELKVKLLAGEEFGKLAKEYSDDASNKDQNGTLAEPVTGAGTYVYEYEQAALSIAKKGEITDPVETQFGYHLIKADNIMSDVKEQKYKYETIKFSTLPDSWQETGLNGQHFKRADVVFDNLFQPMVSITFNEEGAKLFEQITEKNVGKPVAIFVGGNLISSPNVNEKIVGGNAQISGNFTTDEANNLARDLNTGAIPAPIVLTGEYTIGATLGQEALTKSLYAGAIGLLLVMIFMAFYYRAAGVVANIALAIYAAILIFLIKSQLHIGIAIILSLGIFGYLIAKTLNNKDSGLDKLLTFTLSCFAFFFVTYLLKTGVVLTLAGVAGIIFSIGMAVDANILIFERFKEEMRDQKSFTNSAKTAFDRAWSAIRDSNFSTLLTCAILFYFGSSIIKGFAFNLAAGVLVSMFTAIVVTRSLLLGLADTKLAKNHFAMGLPRGDREPRTINFIKHTNLWLGISGALVTLSIISIAIFGLNLGIDFKGGTLMEFNFSETVTKDQLAENLGTLESVQISESAENQFIVKSGYLTSEQHDTLIASMKEKLPSFTEPRFTTIGPVIGSTLLKKASYAIVVALIMIILYIGFAFRRVPKEVSPWKFGATAIITLAHDVIITTGVFSLLGHFLNVEIDSLFITAILTVFGYSVNDTIVIFDRLRENLIKSSGESLASITNKSLTQTLARSINTSLSTIITLVAILFWGSSSIFYFVLALTLGIGIGTYSSIFTASPILVWWTKKSKK